MLIARSVRLLVPVGLEKSLPGDFDDIADYVGALRQDDTSGPAFWPIPGEILTEIEAVEALTGANATGIGAGGIGGAEGAVRLLIDGSPEQLDAAGKLIDDLQGEPAFLEDEQHPRICDG